MPFSTVSDARKRVSALKNLSTKQVKSFISVFNSLVKGGTKEDSAIPQAISAAKKVDKSMAETEISKVTVHDIRHMLSDAITQGFVIDFDLDENVVFIEKFDDTGNKFKTFKHSFTRTDTTVDIEEEGVEVIRTTDFKEVEKSLDDEPLTAGVLMKIFDKFFASKDTDKTHQVIKQFDEEEMVAIEPLYIAAGEVDGHGDTISLDDTHGMVDSLNKAISDGRLQSGLFHKHKTDSFTIEKAWVNEVECKIGDTDIPAGQPIVKVKFHNDQAWKLRKAGELSGLSIGARATAIEEIT